MTRFSSKMPAAERLIRASKVDPETGCWVWQKGTCKGYARLSFEGRMREGHRLSYEIFVGLIPSGLTVDHLCFNPPCINPDHLRLLSLAENAANQRRVHHTHCANGHEFTPENTYIAQPQRYLGGRRCRACNLAAVKRYDQRRKAS